MYYRILMRHKVSLIDLEFVSFNIYIELRNMQSSLWECNVILSIVVGFSLSGEQEHFIIA